VRRAQKDYEDKAMSTKPPEKPPQTPAPGAGQPVDVRPSEREAVEASREGKPRPSEAEAAAARAKATEEAAEAAAEQNGEQPPLKDTGAKPAP
jgi:hypothetical protein